MAVQNVAGAASQLINSSLNLAVPVQVPGYPETSGFTVNVWINANWGTSAASRGRRSFVGFYGPAAPTPGLVGTYYNGVAWAGTPLLIRNEPNISFNYPTGPGGSVPATNWSSTYSGYFVPPSTGQYYFQTNSDDGIRVTVNGVIVINNVSYHGSTVDTSTVALRQSLVANVSVPILVEYFQGGGDAILDLRYGIGTTTAVAGTFTTIPSSMLTQTVSVANATTALQIGSSLGSGDISVWTYGGTPLATTPADYNNALNNTWLNVCYTFDGSNHLIYVNGDVAATGTVVQNPGTLKYVVINGFWAGAANETDNHYVDCYMLYNRCLTPDEVGTIYQAEGGRHGIWNGQIAYYEFDELSEGSSVSKILDLSGSGADLLVVGAGTAPKYSYSNTVADSNIRPPTSP